MPTNKTKLKKMSTGVLGQLDPIDLMKRQKLYADLYGGGGENVKYDLYYNKEEFKLKLSMMMSCTNRTKIVQILTTQRDMVTAQLPECPSSDMSMNTEASDCILDDAECNLINNIIQKVTGKKLNNLDPILNEYQNLLERLFRLCRGALAQAIQSTQNSIKRYMINQFYNNLDHLVDILWKQRKYAGFKEFAHGANLLISGERLNVQEIRMQLPTEHFEMVRYLITSRSQQIQQTLERPIPLHVFIADINNILIEKVNEGAKGQNQYEYLLEIIRNERALENDFSDFYKMFFVGENAILCKHCVGKYYS